MLPIDTPPHSHQPIWFPAKRFGWGWGLPIAWQGWAVLVAWLVAVTAGSAFLAGRNWFAFAAFMALMAALLVAVCYAKGQRPRWRWGS